MRKNKLKILIALSVFFATLLASIFLWRGLESKAEETLRARIAAVSDKLGIPFSFDYLELGLGVATLHGVSIGDNAFLQIESVKVEASINLLDPQILNPEVIHLFRPVLDTTIERAQYLKSDPKIQKILEGILSPNKGAEIGTGGDFRWPLPKRIRISDGSFILRDRNSYEVAHAIGVNANLNKVLKRGTFKATSIKYRNDIERNVEGRVKLDDVAGNIEFSIARKKSNDSLGWSIAAKISRSLDSADIQVDAKSLPSIAYSRIAKYLSSPEQSGVIGAIGFKKTDSSTWKITSDLRFSHLYVLQDSLSKEPVGPLAFSILTDMTFSPQTRHLMVENGRIGIPDAAGNSENSEDDLVLIAFTASGRLPAKDLLAPRWQAKVRIAPTQCQSALRTIPAQFAPHLKGFQLEGKFGANFDLAIAPESAAAFSYKAFNPTFTCKVAKTPDSYSKSRLSGPFTLERAGSRGQNTVEIPLMPNTPNFTPLAQIGKRTTQAIIASEDAGYYAHNGVEWAAMEQALRRNLAEKRIAIGGSTITMQTVKNLFLTGERTFGRKFQELFLSWHLDQELSKDRILEIYMNIVEFGPNVFGITAAAKHFFDKTPVELTLKEATYLASVMPAPVTRYRYFCLGRTSPNYDELIDTLLRRMHSLNRISYEQYVEALNEPLIFNQVSRLATNECNGVKQIARETSLNDSLGE